MELSIGLRSAPRLQRKTQRTDRNSACPCQFHIFSALRRDCGKGPVLWQPTNETVFEFVASRCGTASFATR
jgi:hypothetical protein